MNRTLLILVGSFLLTFTLLVSVWMVAFGGFSKAAEPIATPRHTPYYTLAATPPPPTATLTPTPTPTPKPTPKPTPVSTGTHAPTGRPTVAPSSSGPAATFDGTPAPLRTPPGSFVAPTFNAGDQTQTVAVYGSKFVFSQVPDGGKITPQGDGIIISTTSSSSDALWVTYRLDPSVLPAGAVISSVNAKICGQGAGQFWEAYGPVGSTPTEYEARPPDADGCWHFTDAPPTDISVIASTMLDSQMYIDRIEFTVTFSQ